MKNYSYIIIGLLLGAAILSIYLTKNNQEKELDLTQIPTPTPLITSSNSITSQDQILGEQAQEAQQAQQIPAASTATITTTQGEIVIELFPEAAPNTVANFANKSANNFYDNLTFHRVEDWVVQGGDPSGNGTGGGQMPTELNNNPFIRGSVGIARGGNIQISNASQFFITKTDAPHLDGQYTNFGQVSSGLDVVDSLEIGDKMLSIEIN